MSRATPDKISRGRRKGDLPQKICATCGLPFSWRKKWTRDWDNVRYCSQRCRGGGTRVRGDTR